MPYGSAQLVEKHDANTILAAQYVAAAGSMTVASAAALPATFPYEILVTNSSTGSYRPFLVSAAAGNVLTVAVAEGQADNVTFPIGSVVENVCSAEAKARLSAFATTHTHTGGTDGTVLAHTALSSIGTNTHAQIDSALATAVTNDATAASHIAATAAHGATGAVVGTTNTQTLSGKSFGHTADVTKKLALDLSGATTAKTVTLLSAHTLDRTITLPDVTVTLAGRDNVENLSNKTLVAPTIADFTNAAHDHGDADDGGALVAGAFPTAPGILTAAMVANQSANLVLAGPSSGAAAAPTFRAIVAADLPALTTWTITSVTQAASTPAFTANSVRVWQAGKLVEILVTITFTGAGTAGSAILLNLPASLALVSAAGFPCVGTFIYFDSGTGNYVGAIQAQTTQQFAFISAGTSAAVGANPNIAIANNDTLSFSAKWELA